MLFMGQEFLEDKFWTDNEGAHPGHLIYWDGLESNKTMKDYFQFMKEFIWLGEIFESNPRPSTVSANVP